MAFINYYQAWLAGQNLCDPACDHAASSRQGCPRVLRAVCQGAAVGTAATGGQAPADVHRPLGGRYCRRDRLRRSGLFLPLLPQTHWRRAGRLAPSSSTGKNDDSAVQKARKRKLLDSDYVESGFGSNLGLLKPWTADGADHPDPRGLTDKNVRLHHAANHNRLDCDCNAGGAGQHIRVPFRGTRKGTSCCILQFRSMRTKCGYVTTNVGDLS